jgi:uncharacterized protein YbjT (DUF2867 family)
MPPIKKVVLVGANGDLGPVILEALAAAGFDVTVFVRASSSSKLPDSVTSLPNVSSKAVDDDFAIPSLTEALKGQDAVVSCFRVTGRLQQHLRLAYAAASAGVRRFVPSDFGSCDSKHPDALRRLQIYREKVKVQERCQELAREFPDTFTWTSVVCGHFFDWGLSTGFLHFFLDRREAYFLDGGDIPTSMSTLPRVADATVRLLQRPDATANRTLYVQSFSLTQRQLLASLEKATGGEPWKVHDERSADVLEANQRKIDEDAPDKGPATEVSVHVLGTLYSDWTKKDGFAMDLLGLEDEDLDEVVKKTVEAHAGAKSSA